MDDDGTEAYLDRTDSKRVVHSFVHEAFELQKHLPNLRRITMRILRLALLIMVLFSAAIIAGCHGGPHHLAADDITNKQQVAWEPTQTGFWHP